MSRKIAFRVWDIRYKEMTYPDLFWFEEEGIREVPGDARGYEIMQFTGLKDKHGKDIFEGDIVQSHEHNFKLIVKWSVGTGLSSEAQWLLDDGYYTTELELETKKWDDTTPDCANVDVIGNIYEHPELLQAMCTESWHGYDPLTREKVEGGQS